MSRRSRLVLAAVTAFAVTLVAPSLAAAATVPVTITGAGSVVESTPAALINCSSPNTTPTTSTGATCPGTGYGAFWYVKLVATPAPGYTFAGWAGACTSTVSYCSIDTGFGSHPVTAKFVDTEAPDTVLNAQPPSFTQQRGATFQFAGDQEGATFECRMSGGLVYVPCTSPYTVGPGLSEGVHSMSIRAIDPSGNVDPTPAVSEWRIDLTAPVTTVIGKPKAATTFPTALITVSSNETTRFECRQGLGAINPAAPWISCSNSSTVTTRTEGTWNFQVLAIDLAGNIGAPVTVTWRYDVTAPVVRVVDGPADGAVLAAGAVTIATDVSELAPHRECRIVTPQELFTTTTCPEVATIAGSTSGSYSYSLRARDDAGNQGDWTTRSWTIDADAPSAPQVAGGPGAAPTREASQAFTVTHPEAGATLECRAARAALIADAAWNRCAAPEVVTATSAGDWLFEARAADAVGNRSAVARKAWSFTDAPLPVTPVPVVPDPAPVVPVPAPVPAPAPVVQVDRVAPSLAIRPVTPVRARAARVAVRVTCGEACSLELRAMSGARAIGAAVRATAPAGALRTVTIAIPQAVRAQVARTPRAATWLTIRVVATDAAGNRATRSVRMRILP